MTSSQQPRILQKLFDELIGVFGAANFRIKNFVAAIVPYANTNEKRCSNFAYLFVDGKINIRKKGERYIVGFSKIADFESRVADTDADQLDFVFESFVALDYTVHFVDRGSLPLTERSVHTEYLNDDNVSAYLRNIERFFPCQA